MDKLTEEFLGKGYSLLKALSNGNGKVGYRRMNAELSRRLRFQKNEIRYLLREMEKKGRIKWKRGYILLK